MPGVIVGMDEVGRGCWAGPLVVGGVILEAPINGVKDSKLMTNAQRSRCDAVIREQAVAWGLGWSQVEEINHFGLTRALELAFSRALAAIQVPFDQIILDGRQNFLPGDARVITMTDADASVPAVSAASIIAKVARDAYMRQIASVYPGYGFERHVGYGTQLHRAALAERGICALHRLRYKPIRVIMDAA